MTDTNQPEAPEQKAPDFYIQSPGGYVYPYSANLAGRSDMRPFNGSMEEAREQAKTMTAGGAFPVDQAPVVLGNGVDQVDQDENDPPPANDRIESIRDAIRQLDPDNAEHFTQGGLPRTGAIEALLGDDIEATERDEAWSSMQ
jgi:hypothetical protein